jgi:RNA polymerase sigma-70 factor, ECF subfamily
MAQDLTSGSRISIAAPPDHLEFERFTRRLVGLARAHLGAKLRQKVDPEDVVQSAYKSFIFRYGDAEMFSNGMNALWSLLAQITLRKCADKAHYFQADRRDLTREAVSTASDDSQPWRGAICREPTPEHAVMMAETVENLLSDVASAERPVIELSLQGFSTQEVSERLGRAERSVRRLRERLKKQLERMQIEITE